MLQVSLELEDNKVEKKETKNETNLEDCQDPEQLKQALRVERQKFAAMEKLLLLQRNINQDLQQQLIHFRESIHRAQQIHEENMASEQKYISRLTDTIRRLQVERDLFEKTNQLREGQNKDLDLENQKLRRLVLEFQIRIDSLQKENTQMTNRVQSAIVPKNTANLEKPELKNKTVSRNPNPTPESNNKSEYPISSPDKIAPKNVPATKSSPKGIPSSLPTKLPENTTGYGTSALPSSSPVVPPIIQIASKVEMGPKAEIAGNNKENPINKSVYQEKPTGELKPVNIPGNDTTSGNSFLSKNIPVTNKSSLPKLKSNITRVNAHGLVLLAAGKSAGLQVSETLEVYRLDSTHPNKSLYLGKVKILDVQDKEAVGRFEPVVKEAKIQIGDQVTREISTSKQK